MILNSFSILIVEEIKNVIYCLVVDNFVGKEEFTQ